MLKFERFKHFYETLKLQLLSVPRSKEEQVLSAQIWEKNSERRASFEASADYDLWMKAEIHRVFG